MTQESEEYLYFSTIINEYISANMFGIDLTVKNYCFNYLWEIITAKGVVIRPFPFERAPRRAISGMIMTDENETTLSYNSNMSKKRQNFTVSHELIHFLYHLNDETNLFTDTKESLSYSLAYLLPEFQANIGASSLLLPEPVLINELKEGTSPYFVSEKYGISEKAIYMRLQQQMQASFEASYTAASHTASKIMSGQNKRLSRELGTNLESKVLLTNPFYEAII